MEIKAVNFLVVGNAVRDLGVIRIINKYPTHSVVALDGIAPFLVKNSIKPRYILGDFDSMVEENPSLDASFGKAMKFFSEKPKPVDMNFDSYDNDGISFIRSWCQDYTDLDKSIIFLMQEHKPESIKLLNVLGGSRTDHSLHNLSALKKWSKKAPLHIETSSEIIEFLSDTKISFKGLKGGKVGVIGFPKAFASSKGLVWELDNYELLLGGPDSTCNEIKEGPVELEVFNLKEDEVGNKIRTTGGEVILIRPSEESS